jgi:SOS-response transcriptional repressor LexA
MSTTMRQLTPRQEEVLAFLRGYVEAYGFPPTIREIAKHFGFFHNAAATHVATLERKGMLWRSAGTTRGIFLAPVPAEAAGCDNERHEAELPEGSADGTK